MSSCVVLLNGTSGSARVSFLVVALLEEDSSGMVLEKVVLLILKLRRCLKIGTVGLDRNLRDALRMRNREYIRVAENLIWSCKEVLESGNVFRKLSEKARCAVRGGHVPYLPIWKWYLNGYICFQAFGLSYLTGKWGVIKCCESNEHGIGKKC